MIKFSKNLLFNPAKIQAFGIRCSFNNIAKILNAFNCKWAVVTIDSAAEGSTLLTFIHGKQVGGNGVRRKLESITYNPGKQDCIKNIIGYSVPTVVSIYELLKHPHEVFWMVIMFVFVALDVICVCYILRDPTCKTFTTIDKEGAHILFSNEEKTIFIPWDNDVHVNVCIEQGYPSYRQLIQRRILCLSNVDMKDEFLPHEKSVNWTHEMPTNSIEPWMVFLVVSDSRFKCMREAKRVLAFKEAALTK